jgi:Holliday junction resolvase RusA-like endonuclease
MAARISEKDALKLGLSVAPGKKSLVDPLLQNISVDQPAAPSKKRTSHKAPPVAKRISKGPGPEGTGSVTLNNKGLCSSVKFDFELLPVPKERARTVRTPNNKTVSFTPARTKRFTSDVLRVVNQVMGSLPPIEGPVRLSMAFKMEIPKSWPKWKQEAAVNELIAPTGRPDMDNLEKALLDALNERVFVDDAFVVERYAKKIYSQSPGIFVKVDKIETKAATTAKRSEVETLMNKGSIRDE